MTKLFIFTVTVISKFLLYCTCKRALVQIHSFMSRNVMWNCVHHYGCRIYSLVNMAGMSEKKISEAREHLREAEKWYKIRFMYAALITFQQRNNNYASHVKCTGLSYGVQTLRGSSTVRTQDISAPSGWCQVVQKFRHQCWSLQETVRGTQFGTATEVSRLSWGSRMMCVFFLWLLLQVPCSLLTVLTPSCKTQFPRHMN